MNGKVDFSITGGDSNKESSHTTSKRSSHASHINNSQKSNTHSRGGASEQNRGSGQIVNMADFNNNPNEY
ncbi:MAG: hypothetical protein MJ252_19130 [archaeon]|nr:hypothetical protein [archaeon]